MTDKTDRKNAIRNAHALCLGYGIYKLMTDISRPSVLDPTIESIGLHLRALELETELQQRDFDTVQDDQGAKMQSTINTIVAGIQKKFGASAVAHFVIPVNTFLTVARPPVTSESLGRISKLFSAICLPEDLSQAFSQIESQCTSRDTRQDLLDWIDVVHITYRIAIDLATTREDDTSFLEAIDFKPKFFGITLDVKKLGTLLMKRFTDRNT